jgi:hypothetical protein
MREPVDREKRQLLRRAVFDHVRALRGRSFPPFLHVGTPGGSVRRFEIRVDEPSDQALRADVVATMLGRRGPEPPWVWLTRTGELAPHDLDAEWLAAASTAYGEAGVDLTLVVVNRRGWRDPRSGVGRSWVRLRG